MNDLDALAIELQRIEAAKSEAIRNGIPALHRVYMAATGKSGQSRILRAFIIGIFNGGDHPFDLNQLRALDETLFDDVLDVIRLDRHAEEEVHRYLPTTAQQAISSWSFWNRSSI
ncbi:hypothetical protein [Halothiobacillus sp. 15-55-196]|jgi:hypothetical protein|uniref:DUF7673 family protein n=1 Tax=Halothiobacillus sp. 15-55-196 TaxID=1970382 RepID=UPI0025BEFDA4|nr:hypothetical protein [Halothiobacillus sp. 15-55-196]